jgi:ribonuclease I
MLIVLLQAVRCMYTLTLEWPGTICETRTCSYLGQYDPTFLNIHGLWYRLGSAQSCTNKQACTS